MELCRFIDNGSGEDGFDIYNQGDRIESDECTFLSGIDTGTNVSICNGKNGTYNGSSENILKK